MFKDRAVTKLVNTVNANILGVPFPFVGVDGEDACKDIYNEEGTTNVGCNLKAGKEYVYKSSIEVLKIYPRLGLPMGPLCIHIPMSISARYAHLFAKDAALSGLNTVAVDFLWGRTAPKSHHPLILRWHLYHCLSDLGGFLACAASGVDPGLLCLYWAGSLGYLWPLRPTVFGTRLAFPIVELAAPFKESLATAGGYSVADLSLLVGIKTVVHWALTASDGKDVICFEVPVRITN
ncbi:hypothetical protein NQ317_011898 [Molorchus minor]|uniref:MD-2-related lipid-recognition domain-containing protein n=1 Tax=Molorchus minor TaxID=1323400 RepID=A0ABQ9IXD9_9CUCU|nr:hypothetical protein NQ317_011898 [Molorchus minor]